MFPFRGMPHWAQVIGEGLPLTHFLRIVAASCWRATAGPKPGPMSGHCWCSWPWWWWSASSAIGKRWIEVAFQTGLLDNSPDTR